MIACAIHREGINATLGEHSIRIELADDGGCPFLIVKSADIDDRNDLRLDQDELDFLCNDC